MHSHNFISNTRLPACLYEISALHDNRDSSHNRDVSLPKHRDVQKSNNRSPLIIVFIM